MPALFHPGLLAERKNSQLNFKHDTKGHEWKVKYARHYQFRDAFQPDSTSRLELVIEARLQDVKEHFSLVVNVSRDQSLNHVFEQLRRLLELEGPVLEKHFGMSGMPRERAIRNIISFTSLLQPTEIQTWDLSQDRNVEIL